MWIHVKINSTENEYWFLDYENGIATNKSEKPKHESIRKWEGSLQEYLEHRGAKIIEDTQEIVKFKPNPV